jgi:hypothetical protein
MSNAVKGITAKFMYIFEGPFLVSKILEHSAYELKDEWGKVCGEFNKKQLREYREEKRDHEGEEQVMDSNKVRRREKRREAKEREEN